MSLAEKEDKKQKRHPQKRQQTRKEMGRGEGLMTHTWPQQRQHAENGQSQDQAPAAHCFTQGCQATDRCGCTYISPVTAERLQDQELHVHDEQTDSLPPSNMGMVFMKNSLEATWSASKTQMSSDPGTRVPGGYIWEHTLLMFPDFPFISPAPNSKSITVTKQRSE